MATCGAKHEETGAVCERDEHPDEENHVRYCPVLVWCEPRPLCGARHSSGVTCGKDAHPAEEWHSAGFGAFGSRCHLTWREGREDRWHFPEGLREGNERAEAAERSRYAWERGESETEGWRFEHERWR